jgi:hypothetical protein
MDLGTYRGNAEVACCSFLYSLWDASVLNIIKWLREIQVRMRTFDYGSIPMTANPAARQLLFSGLTLHLLIGKITLVCK